LAAEAERALAYELPTVIAEVNLLIERYQLTEAMIFGTARTARPGKPRTVMVPKYVDQATGNTWTGRGPKPVITPARNPVPQRRVVYVPIMLFITFAFFFEYFCSESKIQNAIIQNLNNRCRLRLISRWAFFNVCGQHPFSLVVRYWSLGV
jgi:DNA-binding protein H-NS